MAEDGAGRIRSKPPKLTIDDYVDVFHNRNHFDLLTVDHLNKIIDMHGFNKMHKTQKRIMTEAVKNIELMDPYRSTIQDDGVSSDAFIPLDDVVKDLYEINWQECCITSLQTLNAVNHHHGNDEILNNAIAGGSITGTTVLSADSEKPKRKRRRLRKLAQIGGEKDSISNGLKLGGSGTASCSSTALIDWGPQKKRRSMKYVDLSGIGNDGAVNFGFGVAAAAAPGEVQVPLPLPPPPPPPPSAIVLDA
ncbi:hypothetical protein ACH5RR_028547 [Cinchona calisaya]|uniref:DUF7787 domain-containing protein n=1 Tax=Cinchona calisaya TaxID=153742 RepID=A0ABD2YQH2_9GENT